MKFPIANFPSPISRNAGKSAQPRCFQIGDWRLNIGNAPAFTMIEVAICLAIIGFALVAIIGVLPLGMNTQRSVREETIINQDASVLLESIRNAARGANDLTNYVYAITNYWTLYDDKGVMVNPTHIAGYTFKDASLDGTPTSFYITNAARIIGLLSTPEYTDTSYRPITDFSKISYISNHVVAYVRSISGVAVEKPPQDNGIMVENTFSYRLFCVNAPMPVDTNTFAANNGSAFATRLAAAQRELRMTFLWPLLPNGKIGNGRQTFRTTIAGQLTHQYISGFDYYFYQPLSFTNAP